MSWLTSRRGSEGVPHRTGSSRAASSDLVGEGLVCAGTLADSVGLARDLAVRLPMGKRVSRHGPRGVVLEHYFGSGTQKICCGRLFHVNFAGTSTDPFLG